MDDFIIIVIIIRIITLERSNFESLERLKISDGLSYLVPYIIVLAVE
jgi:hypothetical protein